MKIEHKIFETEVKAFDDENLIVDHFISTEHKDRGGDVMRAKGMKVVGKPVVLLLHGRGSMGSEPVAKPLSITIDEFKGAPGILAKTQFFPDEIGMRLYAKVKGGFMPNWSIGYSVDESKDIMVNGTYGGRDVTKWQLLEYSPVGVPMNPFAQTIKEFLDGEENVETVGEEKGAWFGIVEEKTCTGCGACKGKGGECPTCKQFPVLFVKDGNNIGVACEKCQPEEFKRLSAEILPPQDPVAALHALLEELRVKFTAMDEAQTKTNDALKKLESLLVSPPPSPEGGEKGTEDEGNPPEPPARLVFLDVSAEAKRKKDAANALTADVVRAALRPVMKQQVDSILGKVN